MVEKTFSLRRMALWTRRDPVLSIGIRCRPENKPAHARLIPCNIPNSWAADFFNTIDANRTLAELPMSRKCAIRTSTGGGDARFTLIQKGFARLFDCAAGNAGDEAVEEQVIGDRHRNACDQRTGHDLAPEKMSPRTRSVATPSVIGFSAVEEMKVSA